ncbi:uncharacterized protein LOC130715987 [Lotus japonicus]|uniref:Uncharacterized protein n=1 Tax=Lotus japonicus TaxID=34305 RepID=I3SRF3_LOTJA|nr:uncharacterized protein LOC130715987 [Lotus japonicus]AFK42845.1 unknown [Lotus japonicus]
MAFTISKSQSAITESEKEKIDEAAGVKDSGGGDNNISSQLHLKSPEADASSKSLDKNVVLRRILQRKIFNKAKTAFESLLGSSEANSTNTSTSTQELKWLQHGDVFSAP